MLQIEFVEQLFFNCASNGHQQYWEKVVAANNNKLINGMEWD